MKSIFSRSFTHSLEYILFSYLYPTIPLKSINHYIQKLIQKLNKPLISKMLAEKCFWEKLIHETQFPDKAKELEAYWRKIEPLAHLNAKELLLMLNEEIRSLEKYLAYSEAKLSEDNQYFWRPEWLEQKKAELLTQIKLQIKKVTALKQEIHNAMLIRCKANADFDTSPYCDNSLGLLVKEINLIQSNSKKHIQEQTVSIVSDDIRIAIYDVLNQTSINKRKLEKIVISPIKRKAVKSLVDNQTVAKELNVCAEFIHKILHYVQNDNAYKKLFSYRAKEMDDFTFNAIKAIKNFFKDIKLFNKFSSLHRYRYILYFAASFIAYGAIVTVLLPMMVALLPAAVINMISSMVFLTIGIAPLWYLFFKHGRNYIESARQLIFINEKQELLDALMSYEVSAYFIADRLSQTIVDLAHFDIEGLIVDAQYQQKQLREHISKLSHRRTWKAKLMPVSLKKAIDSTRNRMLQQSNTIENRLSTLASHIAKDIKNEISLLCASVDNRELITSIPLAQMSKIEQMVQKYGSADAKKEFEDNTNLAKIWLQKINVQYMGLKTNSVEDNRFSWGGFDIRQDVLNGWKLILNQLMADSSKRSACLKINDFLAAKGEYTLASLKDDLKKINEEQADETLTNIQWYVFNTLSQRSPSHACILSQAQLASINAWYEANKNAIHQAHSVISKVFNCKYSSKVKQLPNIPDATLCNYYELLDFYEIYLYANKKYDIIANGTNYAKNYFNTYKGEHSFAYRLLKFVSIKDRSELLIQVATKRLQWILSHLDHCEKGVFFDELDGELFHNFGLLELNVSFSFDKAVLSSAEFNQPYNAKMENFLIACQSHGFDCKNLLESYRERHYRTKQMHQFKTKISNNGRSTPAMIKLKTQRLVV